MMLSTVNSNAKYNQGIWANIAAKRAKVRVLNDNILVYFIMGRDFALNASRNS